MTNATSPDADLDVAASFVQTLTARGVRLVPAGKWGLAMIPKHAYGEMSAEGRKTLKQHKAAIIAVVKAGTYATPSPAATRVERPMPIVPRPPVPVARPTPPPPARSAAPDISEREIEASLLNFGDDLLADYKIGKLRRDEALAIAAHRRAYFDQISAGQPHWSRHEL
jgi:hypothetical protein